MKVSTFRYMCLSLVCIGQITDKADRDRRLNEFMSAGYLWLDLTDEQVKVIREILIHNFPDIYKMFDKPDENGYTASFMYLRFK